MKHVFQSGVADGGDSTQVRPSDWNRVHVWVWRAVSTTQALTAADNAIRASGTITLTLPALSTMQDGQPLKIKNVGTGVITLARAGSDGIDNAGETQYLLPNQNNSVELVADKTNNVWQVWG